MTNQQHIGEGLNVKWEFISIINGFQFDLCNTNCLFFFQISLFYQLYGEITMFYTLCAEIEVLSVILKKNFYLTNLCILLILKIYGK